MSVFFFFYLTLFWNLKVFLFLRSSLEISSIKSSDFFLLLVRVELNIKYRFWILPRFIIPNNNYKKYFTPEQITCGYNPGRVKYLCVTNMEAKINTLSLMTRLLQKYLAPSVHKHHIVFSVSRKGSFMSIGWSWTVSTHMESLESHLRI